MAGSTATKLREANGAPTVAGWRDAGILTVTCPSGFVCKIRPLRIEHYFAFGQTPDVLRLIALGDLRETIGNEEKVDPNTRAQAMSDFFENYMKPAIVKLVVEPELTLDDLPFLPPADIDFFQAVINRNTTEDARGKALGPESLDRWAIFREKHECADGCEACEGVFAAVSAFGR